MTCDLHDRALTSVSLQITTGALLPAGPSNTGELCFRGPNVMIGYLNNPQATKKTIIDGWVHTGASKQATLVSSRAGALRNFSK